MLSVSLNKTLPSFLPGVIKQIELTSISFAFHDDQRNAAVFRADANRHRNSWGQGLCAGRCCCYRAAALPLRPHSAGVCGTWTTHSPSQHTHTTQQRNSWWLTSETRKNIFNLFLYFIIYFLNICCSLFIY